MALPATEIASVHLLVILTGLDQRPVAGRELAEIDGVLGQGLVRAQARVDFVLPGGLGVLVDVVPIHGASLHNAIEPLI